MALFEDKAPGIMTKLIPDLQIKDFQAGGILGNIGWECAGFTKLHQIGGNAVGWIQWDGVRKIAYLNWCQAKGYDWQSDQANYEYLVQETLTSERAALIALRNTTTLQEATDVFEQRDERAGVPALSGRYSYAQRAMLAYGSSTLPVTVKPPVSQPQPGPTPVIPVVVIPQSFSFFTQFFSIMKNFFKWIIS